MDLEWLEHWQASCVAHHVGLWLIEPLWFQEAVSQVRSGMRQLHPRERTLTSSMGEAYRVDFGQGGTVTAATPPAAQPEAARKPYFVDATGMAVIPIDGAMQKGESKYGGANTVWLRRQVRTAAKDPDVSGIMLLVDSPGGTVAGTQDLAEDVASANRVKPVFSHVEDLGASAAFWVMSGTRRITATPTSEIGSIGTLAVVEDYSAVTEKKGIKVHVISTGPYKGAGVPGAPITDDQLAYFRDRVEAVNAHFLAAVGQGRGKSPAAVQEWADGRVWIADRAKEMGLIDGVTLFDQAMDDARAIVEGKEPKAKPQKRNTRAWLADLEGRLINMHTDIEKTESSV